MRPIGIHLSFWQTQWSDPLWPLIAKAKTAGFDVAEFPLLAPDQLDFAQLKADLDNRTMRASCGTGLGPDTDITHPAADIRRAGISFLQQCLESAATLGSPVLGGVTYAPWAVFPGDDRMERRKNCIRSLQSVGRRAGDLGITLCVEVLNRFEGYLLNTVEQGLALLSEVDSPYIKLHLDTFHMNIEEDNIADAIRRAGSHIGHFHCSENNRKVPGEGAIPWSDVFQALHTINYQGYLVVESFVNPAGEVGRGLFIHRNLATTDLNHAAHRAATFLKREAESV